ncbi:MAG: hypothetical protein JWO94_406 [Verrucomicrobiaceae bacterium]|nr:hypothetical protein [Verrucomicrobiaceae bacterium]
MNRDRVVRKKTGAATTIMGRLASPIRVLSPKGSQNNAPGGMMSPIRPTTGQHRVTVPVIVKGAGLSTRRLKHLRQSWAMRAGRYETGFDPESSWHERREGS